LGFGFGLKGETGSGCKWVEPDMKEMRRRREKRVGERMRL